MEYLFIINKEGNSQCLECSKILSGRKLFNVKRHYLLFHHDKYFIFDAEARKTKVAELRKTFDDNLLIKKDESDTDAYLIASYSVSIEIAKAKKSFSDGDYIKNCTKKMLTALGEDKVVEKVDKISLSRQTVTRRIENVDKYLNNQLRNDLAACSYFSICLDESTDITDVSQLLIFVKLAFSDFTTREEMLSLESLHGTTKGLDVFNAVNRSVQEFGGFTKLSSVCTDGAKAMVGTGIGFVGQLRSNDVNVPTHHCIIHQEALCGKSLCLKETMLTVTKVVNMIRGGNKSLSHRKFQSFLEDFDTEYGDLVMYTEVRWLSRGRCLERFFSLRAEIALFLAQEFPNSETNEGLIKIIKSLDFGKSLAFLTDISKHINFLNLNLQGKNKNIFELIGEYHIFTDNN